MAARSLGLAVLTVLLALGCGGRGRLELIPGEQAGPSLAALVDSEPARRLLVDLLARRSLDQHLTAALVSSRDPGPAADLLGLPDQVRLRGLAEEVSVDFAALAFARALWADRRSRTLQTAFDEYVREGAARSEEVLRQPGGFPYTVLFAPAWLYRSHPEVGADFGRQRRLLERLGIPHRLIPNPESASVEDNASAIAATVRETGCAEGRLILVSTSKSGAEVALALSRLLAPEEAACVAGWLNTGGALGGTPLADAALRPPASWFTNLVLWFNGWNRAGLLSMATGPSRERLEGARLPDSVAVVNLVAVPVSGTVGSRLYGSYQILRRHGPNDGVVLLADTVWPGGANLVALGSDHFFTALQEDTPGLALLRAVDTAVRLHGAWPVSAGVAATIGLAE
ncbi:MAG TPA: hypothetical protein VIE37_13810 [Methylomirabilota bacterium]